MKNLNLIMHVVIAALSIYVGVSYLPSHQIAPVLLSFSVALVNVIALILRIKLMNKE